MGFMIDEAGSPIDVSPGLECTKQHVRALSVFANVPVTFFPTLFLRGFAFLSLIPHATSSLRVVTPTLLHRASVEVLGEEIIC